MVQTKLVAIETMAKALCAVSIGGEGTLCYQARLSAIRCFSKERSAIALYYGWC